MQTKTAPTKVESVNIESTAVNDSNIKTGKALIEKLNNAMPEIRDMQAVAKLTGHEFPKGKIDLVTQVGNYFKSLGNKVTRKGFGDIIIDSNTVKDDMAHGIGRAKSVTFKAVPAVLENGIQIDYQKDWKGRGKDSYVFAAPIDIGGEKAYVCAVVLKGKDKRFYLHEVVNDKGERIYLANKKEPDAFKTGDSQQSGISRASNSSVQIVPHPASESQEKRVENSEVNVSERENEVEKLQSLESEESIQADIERIDAENKSLENELENSTDEPDTDESIIVPTATRAARYEIDEKTAELARNMRSQRGYKAGEATRENQ